MTVKDNFLHQARNIVMLDLVNCLLAETLIDADELEPLTLSRWQHLAGPAEIDSIDPSSAAVSPMLWRAVGQTEPAIVMPLFKGIAQAWQLLPGAAVYRLHGAEAERLDPVALMAHVIAVKGDRLPGSPKGAELFLDALRTSIDQTAWSHEHKIEADQLLSQKPYRCMQILEQWAALRDRPFHPVAKAKLGFTESEYRYYSAEFNTQIPLRWVAVQRDHLVIGWGVDDACRLHPARFLLDIEEQALLDSEMRQRQLTEDWVALPILEWQLNHGLPPALKEEQAAGHWLALDFRQPRVQSTSSVRSMAPLSDSPHYLKLPLSIYSLGSSRYLPAVKMMNGQIAQKLLHEALALDPVLNDQVWLCDETKWWAFMPENGSLFDDAPRHLSAMVRTYPEALLNEETCRLVPMSALGTALPNQQRHFFDEWLGHRQLPANEASVLLLFRELCESFFGLNLRMFRLGILPEIHGQNAVLVWRDGRADGLLLRDHDSLRLFVPWLNRVGLADPVYRLKKGVVNTLYHDTAEDLLFYLLTLGIQVNFRAIIEVLARNYGLGEHKLWLELKRTLKRLIKRLDPQAETRALLEKVLFEDRDWPLKLLISPMLERAGGTGSMPFGKGKVQNPFRHPALIEKTTHQDQPEPVTEN